MNRREFIAIAGAAIVMPASSTHGVVLFDARYGESRAFATACGQRGFVALPTNQDLVRLWYEDVTFRTAQRLAGVTPHSDFEVLRQLLKEKRVPLRLTSSSTVAAHSLVSWQFA
jgi:hypothetical protein